MMLCFNSDSYFENCSEILEYSNHLRKPKVVNVAQSYGGKTSLNSESLQQFIVKQSPPKIVGGESCQEERRRML